MPRRRKKKANSVPSLPLTVRAKVGNRFVAQLKFGDDPGLIIAGSVVWLADPSGVSIEDRERAAGDVVRKAKLDPKIDHDRVYVAIWGNAPKPKLGLG